MTLHPADRLARMFGDVEFRFSGGEAQLGHGFFYRRKRPPYHWQFVDNPSTQLLSCIRCGLVSTPKRVQWRSNVPPIFGGTWSDNYLCMSCWAKASAVFRMLRRADELARLSGELEREARAWERNSAR